MKKYKRVKIFKNRNRKQNSRKNEKVNMESNQEKSEERMNREIQQKTTTMKKLRFLRGVHMQMKVNM